MKFFLYLILAACSVTFAANGTEDPIAEAEKLYKEGKKEESKKLYLEAASNGNPIANYWLAYAFSINERENYRIAAESGHGEALKSYLEQVFFRAEKFEDSDIKSGLDIYQKAKTANKNLKMFNEEGYIRIMNLCLEAGVLDFKSFSAKYGAKPDEVAWEWAEKISEQEINPKLVFQLICEGSGVPFELIYSVNEFYQHWKNNERKVFDKCGYASSNSRLRECSYIKREKFVAPPGGPSFDCRNAKAVIDKTICSSQELARSDLQLANTYNSMRQGIEAPAKQQLLAFQREWVKKRNAECSKTENVSACLEKSYKEQYEKLQHWNPTR